MIRIPILHELHSLLYGAQELKAASTFTDHGNQLLRAAWLLTCFIAFDVALADASLRPVDSIELKIGGVPPTEATSESGL